MFLSAGCFPRRTDHVAFKFTPRLKVEWQGEGEKVYEGYIDYGLRGLKGVEDKQFDHV